MTESEILPPSEEPESSSIEDLRISRELDEATHEPGAHIEKNGDVQTAETIEALISNLTPVDKDGIPHIPPPPPSQIFPIFKNGDPITPEWGNTVVTNHHNHDAGVNTLRLALPDDQISGANISENLTETIDEDSKEDIMADPRQVTPIQEVEIKDDFKVEPSQATLKEDKGDGDIVVDTSQLKPKEDDDDDEERGEGQSDISGAIHKDSWKGE